MAQPPAPLRAQIRLQILGRVRLWRDGAELAVGPRQQAVLLAVLLARVGQPVSRAELIDLLWGQEAPASALNVIHKYVGSLRRLLEPGLTLREAGSYLQRRGDGYVFGCGTGELDLVTFRRLVEAGRTAAAGGEREVALDRFVEALALWRGAAADGLDQAPVFVALDREFYDACLVASDLAVRRGRPERVLAALRLAASMAPLDEAVHAALIIGLAAGGHRAEALAVFRTIRARLAEELGIDPGAALRTAQRRALTQTLPTAAADDGGRSARAGLVGRTGELAVLRESLTAALAGGTGIVVIEGEPGVGKTRLLREAAAESERRGALVVWGSCLEGAGTPSMWPWLEAVRAILESLPAATRKPWLDGELGRLIASRDGGNGVRPLPESGTQFRLFEQVVALVREVADQRPVQIVIDDLHWADTASLQLLGHLVARLPHRTVIVVVLRDRAPAPTAALSRTLGAVSRVPGHRRIRLRTFTVDEVAELLHRESGRDPGGAAAEIHARTSGNAYLVLELSRRLDGVSSSAGAVPATVRDVVRTRTADLAETALDLLRLAALIGRQFGLRLLVAALELDVQACLDLLEPLGSLGLVEPVLDDPYTFRFSHDLVREAVVAGLPVARTAALHLRIADAIERGGGADEWVAEQLAYHLWASGPLADPVRTATALVRAGRHAVTKFAFEAAERHLQGAARVAREAGQAELELSAVSLLATVFWSQHDFVRSYVEILERARHLAKDLGRTTQATEFLLLRLALATSGARPERGQLARRLFEQGEAATDPALRSFGAAAWGIRQWDLGDITQSLRYLRESSRVPLDAVPAPERDQLPREVVTIRPLLQAVVETMHDELDAAHALLDDQEAGAGDDPQSIAVWAHFSAMAAAMAGDLDQATRAARRWIAADPGHIFLSVDSYLRITWCWVRALTGHDPAEAAAEAEQVLVTTLLDPPRFGIAFHYGLIVDMFLAAGMTEQARAALERAEWFLQAHGQRYAEGLLLLLRARLLHAAGEPDVVVRAAAEKARTLSIERGAHLFARRTEEFLAGLPAPC
ncbi:AAA family ATPase [Amycolatopsis vastitatis]|uniref:Transcriptional regulator n=1 Tax=Amycolatopsis vastitatis TaxID=1905142 RepID=A0A229SKD9_9PSEU|nr:AAA family ATPase [Amycolatopsis vastitatis]OXM59296.1 transcriptional regulator [Amycolatopsis vastitatis]